MTEGHREAQRMFQALGRALGYEARLRWSASLPTDGVWLVGKRWHGLAQLPAAALEVAVTESPKTLAGSLAVLARVSPALGVLLVHEEEIQRRLVRTGVDPNLGRAQLELTRTALLDQIARTTQRIELWSFAELRRRYELACGRRHAN